MNLCQTPRSLKYVSGAPGDTVNIYSTNFYRGTGSALRSNPLPFCTPILTKRYPFHIPPIDKWYPFHIPSLEICIPLNCCKCTFLKIWILITKPERFLDSFIAINCICYPFWAFLPTQMTDFPNLSSAFIRLLVPLSGGASPSSH